MADPLPDRLWQRLDADGSLRSQTQLARLVGGNRLVRVTLGALGMDQSKLSELVRLLSDHISHRGSGAEPNEPHVA